MPADLLAYVAPIWACDRDLVPGYAAEAQPLPQAITHARRLRAAGVAVVVREHRRTRSVMGAILAGREELGEVTDG